jgi:hypothetical protein
MLESVTANGHSFEECKDELKKSCVSSVLIRTDADDLHVQFKTSSLIRGSKTFINGARRTIFLLSLCRGEAFIRSPFCKRCLTNEQWNGSFNPRCSIESHW